MARTAGEVLSWALIGGLGVWVVARPIGCVPDGPATEQEETLVQLENVLQSAGSDVVVPTLDTFSDRAEALTSALDAWRAALESGDGVAEREAAQQAWIDAMDVWQELEVMQIGPAGPSISAVGGEDLRDAIYSWPEVNPCRVDQETVEAVWDEPDFFTANLTNAYGLDAIEYLLFDPDTDNACPNQLPLNSNGDWDALGPDGVLQSRATFAVALSEEVERVTADLQGRWDGEFSLLDSFDSQQEALNAIFDALFYLEIETKDTKLAEPLGIGGCTVNCFDVVESQPSGTSHLWIRANLRGFRNLMMAGDAPGLIDLLRQQGQDALADDIETNLLAAEEAAAVLDAPLDETIENDRATAEALHAAVKDVADILKGDLATTLALQIPGEAAGDND
jgi:predicted lipoprotein